MDQMRRVFTWLIAGLTFSVLVAVFCLDFSSLWDPQLRSAGEERPDDVTILPPAPPLPAKHVRRATPASSDEAETEPRRLLASQSAAVPSLAKTQQEDLPDELPEFPISEALERETEKLPAATANAGPREASAAGKVGAQIGQAIAQGSAASSESSPGVADASDSTAGSMALSQHQARRGTPATETAQPGALPDWVHRLPEVVASVPRRPSTTTAKDASEPQAYPVTNGSNGNPIEEKTGPAAPIGTAVAESRGVTQKVDDSWLEPETLIETLNELASIGPTSRWAAETVQQIKAFGAAANSHSPDAPKLLARLLELERQASQLAASLPDRNLARRLRKAGYALARRVDVWEQVLQISTSKSAPVSVPGPDAARLTECLTEIDALMAKSGEGLAWRQYLMLDALQECAAQSTHLQEPFAREVARQVLIRMTQTPLTPQQRNFISRGPLAVLQAELQKWTAEPVGVAGVLRDIERYEKTGLPSDATRLAAERQHLLASTGEARQRLADRVDSHYRNANLRITVTEKLLNQLIPEQNLEYSQVNDYVQGRPTSGESVMATKLGVRMIPDPKRVLIALEVRGEVSALTATDAGAFRFHNESELYYVAYKPMEINMTGIKVWPVEIDVQNDSHIRGIEAPVDVPLVGALLRGIAKSQAEQAKPAANAEVREKVAAKATERIDAEARKHLKGVVEKMNQRVFDPLNSLALDPVMVAAETTPERFTMRLRVGGEDQLGSHTPRPQAPADSLASLQLHESVLNNGIQRLQLDGRGFMLPELAQHIASRLSLPAAWETSPDNEDVKIVFADRDALTVRCEDGQLAMTLSIAQLSKGSRKWHNFQVRAFYKPEVNGRSAELARDGVIHLMGPRISAGSQIALRGIFARVFSRKSPWQLVPEQFVKDVKLKDLVITQFVIDDGWIGLAFGPKPAVNTARRQRWIGQ